MMRWRIERDYQELKEEFGLSHYAGRGYREFHYHPTLCVTAYGFLPSERCKRGGDKRFRSITNASPTRMLHAARQPAE
jgi:SRSO17 transposase